MSQGKNGRSGNRSVVTWRNSCHERSTISTRQPFTYLWCETERLLCCAKRLFCLLLFETEGNGHLYCIGQRNGTVASKQALNTILYESPSARGLRHYRARVDWSRDKTGFSWCVLPPHLLVSLLSTTHPMKYFTLNKHISSQPT